jgi:polyhydroxybutyrate depolymerase
VAGETNQTIQVGGTSRTYILHIPAKYTGQSPVPLVLDFHPLGGTGASEKSSSGFAALSDSEGFIIAWPNGIDNAWNIGPCCTNSRTVDDLGFAKGMVSAIESSACVDPKHVYSTGFSMGGGMSHYLACNAADIFAAVTPSSFDLLVDSEEPCAPSRPISELSFRGTADTEVPYNGGQGPQGRIDFLGAVGTFMKWAMLDGCTGSPTTSGMEQLYTQCEAGVEVGLYTIQGGGHAPGPAATAWDFLKSKALP